MPDVPDAPQQPPQWDGSQGAPPGQPQWLPPQQQGYAPPGGQYGYAQVPHGYSAVAPSNGLGITGGVCGIVAVVLCWIPFVDYISIVLGALAIIFGAIGVRHANEHGGGGKGMAITGIVTGIVAVVITILFLAVVYAAVTSIQAGVGGVGN
jgi:hypothetical protein